MRQRTKFCFSLHQPYRSVFAFGKRVTDSCAVEGMLSAGSLLSLVDCVQTADLACPCRVAVVLKEWLLESLTPSAHAMLHQHKAAGCCSRG
jgi:hypothetical protein